jgi:hypothetical protein
MAANKSQWKITEKQEVLCFETAIVAGWQHGAYAYGVHQAKQRCRILGVDRDHKTEVFVARFEAKAGNGVWHGYPINYRRASDAVPTTVLGKWLNAEVLSAAKISKITQGKPCRL